MGPRHIRDHRLSDQPHRTAVILGGTLTIGRQLDGDRRLPHFTIHVVPRSRPTYARAAFQWMWAQGL